MENQDKKSSWDELARELGADVPDVNESQPPTAQTTESKPVQPPPAKPLAPPPKRPPASWDSLGSELGLTPAVAPPPTEFETPVAESPPAETPAAAPVVDEPPAAPCEAAVARDEGEPPAVHEVAAEPAAMAAEPTVPLTAAKPKELPPVSPTEEARPGSVSLWHRIFGSPEEQARKIADASTQAEEEDVDAAADAAMPDRADVDQRTARDAAYDRSDEALEAKTTGETADGVVVDSADESAGDRRKRRPRRRRRGRGRKTDEQGGGAGEAAPARADRQQPVLTEEFELDATAGSDGDATRADDEPQTVAPAAKSSSGRSKSPGHRNIPTWEETVGILVDVNMQSRSQRRQSSRSSSRSRPRGRRKKKS